MNIPLNINWQQILLHLLNFLILAVGLYLLLLKPVQKFMKQRSDHYEEQEEQAAKSRSEAEELKKEYEKRIEASAEEIDVMKTEEMKRATKETQEILQHAKSQAGKIISEAEKEAQVSSKKAFKNSQRELAQMVVSAAEKLMIKEHSSENDLEIYDKFLLSLKEGERHDGEQE